MKQGTRFVLAATVAALTLGGGYWLGAHKGAKAPGAMEETPATSAPGKAPRKLLYYRNPMGLPDTSPTPKKDPMGMEYIAVYEGEDEASPASSNQIVISTDKVQKLGVKSATATVRTLDRTLRAAGRVEANERNQFAITAKFEGYIERLFVNASGQPVTAGQPLFEVYSPELVSAQREYVLAVQGVESLKGASSESQKSLQQLAEASLIRLKNWGISEDQLAHIAKTGETRRTLTYRSPVSGLITEKKVLQGMRFMPGETLYEVADLSSVWIIADVFEQDLSLAKAGAKAKVSINAYPDKQFEATITYVYPTLKSETRTVPVRLELANPKGLLKPGMFAQVDLPVGGVAKVVTVPISAVIDSGTRRIVLIQAKEGRFEPREVKLGGRSDDLVEVMEGVKEGEQVVVAANFLIDAESNLKAAIGGLGHEGHGATATPKAEEPATSIVKGVSHQATGKIEDIDLTAGTISLNHGPVATLKWPAMTMEFKVANAALLQHVSPGSMVTAEFVERSPGEWVVIKITPAAGQSAMAPATSVGKADPHAGH
jgi:Cu(I)/Ag(I) efflux system membrane fusion protein